jgi:hypothetical protein
VFGDFVCKGSKNIGLGQECGANVHDFAGRMVDYVAVVGILYR